MTKTIILPVDEWTFSERAIPCALALAAAADAQLVLVMDDAARLIRSVPAEEHFGDLTQRHGITSPEVRVTTERGVVRTIEHVAREYPDPVIVLATHAPLGVEGALIGSYAEGIVRRSSVPVVLVGPKVDVDRLGRLEEMLVCTDGSPAAESVLPVASEWIEGFGMRASVVEVLDPDAPLLPNDIGNDVIESGAAQAFAHGLGSDVPWEVLHSDDAADAIVDYAAQLSTSLIAMSTHGRSGLSRLAMGSTTMSVVHNATCPVLVVRASEEGSN